MITDEAGRVLAAETDNDVYVRPTGPWNENQLAPAPKAVICAWCPTFDPQSEANRGASHGMCPTCFARMMHELDAKEEQR